MSKFLDRLETRWNACSLETHPSSSFEEDAPIVAVIGCYELEDDSNHRHGQLLLHSIQQQESLKFHHEQTIDTESGVLDGKWCTGENPLWYATANASGKLHLYELCTANKDTTSESSSAFQLKHLTCSEANVEEDGLALSLAWDSSPHDNISQRHIVSSYSKGGLAVHAIPTTATSTMEMEQVHRWKAHSLFGCDAEVWTACFANSHSSSSEPSNEILSGGDDGQLKLWDLRLVDDSSSSTQSCVASNKREFEAGVTTISYHPTEEYLFAVGSYDEYLRLFDKRNLMVPLQKRCHVGGGVWRIKWQPTSPEVRLLVAAMHGGCRIVHTSSPENEMTIQKEFVEHKSMAYGADWITKKVAASCSFYDRQVFLWNTTTSDT